MTVHPTADYSTDYLSAAEERTMADRIARGDLAARDRLVATNLAFARMLAAKYVDRGLDLDDLEQHARIGLIDAARVFDPSKGRFRTIAGWHVLKHLRRAVRDESTTIRVPGGARDAMSRALRGDAKAAGSGCVAAAVRAIGCRAFGETRSYEDDIDRTAFDWADIPAPVEDEADAELIPGLRTAVAALPDRLAGVVRLRFGLDDDRLRTLKEVGDALGLTRERIRQLEGQALELLRDAARAGQLVRPEAATDDEEPPTPTLTLTSEPPAVVEPRPGPRAEALASPTPQRLARRRRPGTANQLWFAFGLPA